MPSPIGVADLAGGARHAASNSFGSLYLSPRTMMAQAIREILLAAATAASSDRCSIGKSAKIKIEASRGFPPTAFKYRSLRWFVT